MTVYPYRDVTNLLISATILLLTELFGDRMAIRTLKLSCCHHMSSSVASAKNNT